MNDVDKVKQQLINELEQLRQQITQLQASEEERKRIEEELRLSETKYRALVDNANEIIVVVQDNVSKFSNRKAVETTGFSQDELTSRPFLDFVYPDDREIAIENYSMRLKGDWSTPGKPVRIVSKDGSIRWVEFSDSQFSWEREPAVLYLVNDVTEWKNMEEALRESEAKYRDLAESITDVFFAMDENLGYTYWNKASEELTGITAKDALGKSIFDLFPDDDSTRRAVNLYRGVLATREPQHLVNEQTIGGKDYVFEISAYPTTNGLCVYVKDISERRKLEKALEESEQYYRHIFDNAPFGIAFSSIDGKLITINRAMETITGYSAEEFTNVNMVDTYINKAERELLLQQVRQRGVVVDYAAKLKRKDGTPRDTLLSFRLTNIGDQEFVQTICHDVTERKRAEEALKESEARFRAFFEDAPVYCYMISPEGKILDINKLGLRALGYAESDLIGKPIASTVYAPDSREMAIRLFDKLRETGKLENEELKIVTIEGDQRTVLLSADAVNDSKGNPIYYILMQRDITERKRTEEALRKSEESYRLIAENASDVIWTSDTNLKMTYISPSCIYLHGYTPEEALNLPIERGVTPESYEKVINMFTTALADEAAGRAIPGRTRSFEAEFIRKDGSMVWTETVVTFIRNEGGKAIGIQGVTRDIDARKKAEEQLQREKDRAQRYLDIAGVMLVAIGTDGKISMINRKGCEVLGYEQEEIVGKNWLNNFVPHRVRSEVSTVFEQFISGTADPDIYFENPVLTKNGYERMIAWHNAILRDGAGNIIGTLSSGEDITERKEAEEALRASEARYRLLAENVRDVIWATDMDFRFTYVSPSVKYIGGRTAEEVMSMSFEKLLTPSSQERALKVFNEELARAKVMPPDPSRSRTVEIEFIRRDGSLLWAELKMSFIRELDGRPIGILGVMRDISERKKAEEERREFEQKAQLASRLASIGELASGIAHEINNPLTGVIGYAELLMQEDVPEHIRKDLEVIHDGGQRVAGIVKGLLKFARQTKPERVLVNINEIVQVTLQLRAYELETSNIKVTASLAPDLPLTVADPGQLQQVFLNLLINAEMEMKLAHDKGKLIIKTQSEEDNIRISFKDDGPGIAEENLEKIFDPFFTTREIGQGTGLGLSICHGIVTDHGGKIWAESQLGRGATFIVELPIVRQERHLGPKRPVPKKQKTIKGKILVVDDELVVRQLLSQILTEEGHKVETTADGKNALKKIKSNGYSLILIDMKLPGMSGGELYERIQGISASLAKRVVFVTGDVMGADTEAFFTKTGAPFIAKPFNVQQLKAEIRRLLTPSRPRRTAKARIRKPNRKLIKLK